MRRMKIVVTGGSGQLGRQVVAELCAAGHAVLSVDRQPHPDGHSPARIGNLLDPAVLLDACEGADGLVHLAAHIAPNIASDTATFNDNTQMTYNALHAAAEHGIRRAVIASSLAAYGYLYGRPGGTPDYLPIDEAHRCRPTDPYGLSKVVGESIADSFALAKGMGIASLRLPGINYDPAFKRLFSLMADPAFRRPGFWTYVDVRDAALACRLGIEASLAGHRIFNIAAPASNMREPTAALIERHFPALRDIRCQAAGNWSGMDCTRAARELGFHARYTWEALASQA